MRVLNDRFDKDSYPGFLDLRNILAVRINDMHGKPQLEIKKTFVQQECENIGLKINKPKIKSDK